MLTRPAALNAMRSLNTAEKEEREQRRQAKLGNYTNQQATTKPMADSESDSADPHHFESEYHCQHEPPKALDEAVAEPAESNGSDASPVTNGPQKRPTLVAPLKSTYLPSGSQRSRRMSPHLAVM